MTTAALHLPASIRHCNKNAYLLLQGLQLRHRLQLLFLRHGGRNAAEEVLPALVRRGGFGYDLNYLQHAAGDVLGLGTMVARWHK